jgi:hypothetical protein
MIENVGRIAGMPVGRSPSTMKLRSIWPGKS